MFDLPYMILIGAIALFSWLVSSRLKSKFEHYSKLTLRNGMSGAEIAEKMLADNGIVDVRVISTPGQLTDHYNPVDKTVNLSEAVYNQRNAAAAAVAAARLQAFCSSACCCMGSTSPSSQPLAASLNAP